MKRARPVRRFLFAAGALLLASPALALAAPSQGSIQQLNAPQVTYRMTGVAYVRGANGKYREQPLSSAALGAGDRIRYLIIATNSTPTPQLAGVSIDVPDFTVWEPTSDLGAADLVSWSQDRMSWNKGLPSGSDAKLARGVRWVLAEKLRGGLSTAFVFQLRLTGPYSDRAADFNMSRAPESKPLQTLDAEDIREVQQDANVGPETADPLGLRQFVNARRLLPHRNADVPTELAVRGGIEYKMTATAYQHNAIGLPERVPLAEAQLKSGDRLRYEFSARNTGDAPHRAGSTFSIPPYARFESASRGGGVVDVSTNGAYWTPLDSRARVQPHYVRWTHANPLAPGETVQFTVNLTVDRGPAPADLARPDAQGSFDALSAAAIQSVLFTDNISTGRRHEYSGVPITDQLIRGAKALALPAMPGFVSSGAVPVEEHTPVDPQRDRKVTTIGLTALGILGVLLVAIFLVVRGAREDAENSSFARRRTSIFGADSELDDQLRNSNRASAREPVSAVDGRGR